jgi:hypothetical protein
VAANGGAQQGGLGGLNSPEELLKSMASYVPDVKIEYLEQSNHPTACLFHLIFKAASLFIYMFGGMFISTFTIDYIVIILSAFDFWTVKNISGRLLVGLRWWSEVRADGTDNWVFETKFIPEDKVSQFNDKIFWGGQMVFGIAWAVLLFINTLGLSVNSICICGFVLASIGVNYYAYQSCTKM